MKVKEDKLLHKNLKQSQSFREGFIDGVERLHKIIKLYEFQLKNSELMQEQIYDCLGDGRFCGGDCECEDPSECEVRDYVDGLFEEGLDEH